MPPTRERIEQFHSWYQRNVMDVRLTPERERLWYDWLKEGYKGDDLRRVIRYIRLQIYLNKRNPGALKLCNLFERSEGGSFDKFDDDLALSKATMDPEKKMEPMPDKQVVERPVKRLPTITTNQNWQQDLDELKRRL